MTVSNFNQQILTSDDIREALNKVVSKKLFWGKQAAKKMAIENVWYFPFIYIVIHKRSPFIY